MTTTTKVIRAPGPIPTAFSPLDRPVLFLAGTCEGEDWREKLISEVQGAKLPCTLLNPLRSDWDSSWKETISDRHFTGQVDWEHEGMEKADYVVMYLAPGSKSPVSLLELGLCAAGAAGDLVLCCPEGYYKRGYVDMVRLRYHIKYADTFEGLVWKVVDLIAAEQGHDFIRKRPDLSRFE